MAAMSSRCATGKPARGSGGTSGVHRSAHHVDAGVADVAHQDVAVLFEPVDREGELALGCRRSQAVGQPFRIERRRHEDVQVVASTMPEAHRQGCAADEVRVGRRVCHNDGPDAHRPRGEYVGVRLGPGPPVQVRSVRARAARRTSTSVVTSPSVAGSAARSESVGRFPQRPAPLPQTARSRTQQSHGDLLGVTGHPQRGRVGVVPETRPEPLRATPPRRRPPALGRPARPRASIPAAPNSWQRAADQQRRPSASRLTSAASTRNPSSANPSIRRSASAAGSPASSAMASAWIPNTG